MGAADISPCSRAALWGALGWPRSSSFPPNPPRKAEACELVRRGIKQINDLRQVDGNRRLAGEKSKIKSRSESLWQGSKARDLFWTQAGSSTGPSSPSTSASSASLKEQDRKYRNQAISGAAAGRAAWTDNVAKPLNGRF